MKLSKKRLFIGFICFFIICSLLFHPAISKNINKIDELDKNKFISLINKNRVIEKQNLENIKNSYKSEYFINLDCSCDQNKKQFWYPKILCSILFIKIKILNIRIFYLEIMYLLFRLKIILNKIMDLLDTKSRLIDLMEVFNCPRIPNY